MRIFQQSHLKRLAVLVRLYEIEVRSLPFFPTVSWCERGDSNPHGFTRQILSSTRTKNQQFSTIWMSSDCLVAMRVSALCSTAQLNAYKPPLGTKLGTVRPCRQFPIYTDRPPAGFPFFTFDGTPARLDVCWDRIWEWDATVVPRHRSGSCRVRHSRNLKTPRGSGGRQPPAGVGSAHEDIGAF